ncbi:MAG: hypothetical protein JWR19_4463 [Pedosphaera sp.]|nr:hypothetical protein [Pedosphaera sp.]
MVRNLTAARYHGIIGFTMLFQQLLIFLKAPRSGQVKTRLIPALDENGACAAYQQLVKTLLARIGSVQDVCLYYTPVDAEGEIQGWTRPGWQVRPQASGDLGDRLHSAFVESFMRGTQRVVIIGSDCPVVSPEDIHSAWAALETDDVVLGPATDGGYWLIGLRQPQPVLFSEMAWSTTTVFRDTLARAGAVGLTVKILRELSDVDTEADWKAFLNSQKSQVNL